MQLSFLPVLALLSGALYLAWHTAFGGEISSSLRGVTGSRASTSDLVRASKKIPGELYLGRTPAHIATRLNAHLGKLSKNRTRACKSFTREKLSEILGVFWSHASPELAGHYDGRDGRAFAHRTTNDFEAAWGTLSEEAAIEAACADLAKLFVHHLSEESREKVLHHPAVSVPLLATFNPKHADAPAYKSSYTCNAGHNMTTKSYDHTWPHWPGEAHYFGYGHGPYPFWVSPKSVKDADPWLEVWYSQDKNAEKLYHNSCAMAGTKYGKNAPCYHLMIGANPSPEAYLYTKDEDFCCISELKASGPYGPVGSKQMTASQADFMDAMDDAGEGTFSGKFYTGPVKKYTMTLAKDQPVSYFFYYTTPDGHPVCQGEGGLEPTQGSGKGIFVWHEYNITTFKATTHDASVFSVPEVCKSTTSTCEFPN